MTLHDCQHHREKAENELIVVEGLSAAANVRQGRNSQTQAILALQGKPVNAVKSSRKRVDADEQLQSLTRALGCGLGDQFDLSKLRYQRISFLFDPDADGTHCCALVQIFIHELMIGLLQAEKISVIRAPLIRMLIPGLTAPVYAYSEQHYIKLVEHFEKKQIRNIQSTRFKGVASLDVPLLCEACLDPDTRHEHILQVEDAALAVSYFGGK